MNAAEVSATPIKKYPYPLFLTNKLTYWSFNHILIGDELPHYGESFNSTLALYLSILSQAHHYHRN